MLVALQHPHRFRADFLKAVAPRRGAGILYTSMNSRVRTPRVVSQSADPEPTQGARSQPALAPIDATPSFKHKAYTALKNAIVAMDIYRSREDIRLDERKLAQDFGISRTPVREAMAQLESEGFVRLVPRRGIYVVRKTKREVIEMITVWAALESMAARLITQAASADQIAGLREMFATFASGKVRANLDQYSEVNIEFHQTIINLSGNRVLIDLAENLFTHMRMIRRKTIVEKDRADRSIRDHMLIIEALEQRATDRAEELVRDHALGLADHVLRFADYLD
jgi:DNA-binding GntR family transcriptional regulator